MTLGTEVVGLTDVVGLTGDEEGGYVGLDGETGVVGFVGTTGNELVGPTGTVGITGDELGPTE